MASARPLDTTGADANGVMSQWVVIPGIIDIHTHFLRAGRSARKLTPAA